MLLLHITQTQLDVCMNHSNDAPARTNIFVDLIDIIAAPGQALRRISFYPRSWWFPALLAILSALLLLWVNLPFLMEQAQKVMQLQLANQNLTPEQLEATQQIVDRLKEPMIMFLQSVIGTLLGLLLAWAFSTLFVFLSASIAGANPKAGSMWALVVWTWIPFVVRNLVYSVFGIFSDTFARSPGLSYFVSTGDLLEDSQNPVYVAAAQVDIFSLWHVILIYLLLRVAANMGRGGAITITILYALVNVGLRAGMSQLSGLFGGGG